MATLHICNLLYFVLLLTLVEILAEKTVLYTRKSDPDLHEPKSQWKRSSCCSRIPMNKWTKHGYVSLFVPGPDPVFALTIFNDVPKNPGPEATPRMQNLSTALETSVTVSSSGVRSGYDNSLARTVNMVNGGDRIWNPCTCKYEY